MTITSCVYGVNVGERDGRMQRWGEECIEGGGGGGEGVRKGERERTERGWRSFPLIPL